MTLAKAVKLLESKYEQAKNMEYVHKPLAWALYQTWKEVDSAKDEKRREYNRIAQRKSRAKRKGGAE
jgi:hypothetical protein